MTNQTPTPRTDTCEKFLYGHTLDDKYTAHANLCRQLERELAEAKLESAVDEWDKLENELEEMKNLKDHYRVACQSASEERDQLKQQVAEMQSRMDECGYPEMLQKQNELKEQLAEANSKIHWKALCQERDQLKEQLAEANKLINSLAEEKCLFRAERDQLKEQLAAEKRNSAMNEQYARGTEIIIQENTALKERVKELEDDFNTTVKACENQGDIIANLQSQGTVLREALEVLIRRRKEACLIHGRDWRGDDLRYIIAERALTATQPKEKENEQ